MTSPAPSYALSPAPPPTGRPVLRKLYEVLPTSPVEAPDPTEGLDGDRWEIGDLAHRVLTGMVEAYAGRRSFTQLGPVLTPTTLRSLRVTAEGVPALRPALAKAPQVIESREGAAEGWVTVSLQAIGQLRILSAGFEVLVDGNGPAWRCVGARLVLTGKEGRLGLHRPRRLTSAPGPRPLPR